MDINHLYGVYQVQDTITYENEVKIDDPVTDGIFTFTRGHLLSVVNGSKESVMAYTGYFEVKENLISIKIITCNRRDLEGTVIERRIDTLTQEQLTLSMNSKDGKMKATIHWKKIATL